MELIERYVKAVGERLHPSRRENVEAELRASILDALESRGASPDSEEDVVAVLSELGEPERLADEYQPNRRYLIGPELFPLFRRVVRVVLVTLVAASMLGFGVLLLLGGLAGFRAGALLIDTLGFAVRAAFVALVVLVAAFAWLQRAEVRLPRSIRPGTTKWDPRSLPARHAAERASRFDALAGLAGVAVVLVVLGGIGQVAREVASHVSADVRPLILDGVIANVMLLQVGLVLSALAYVIALVQGSWRSYTRGMRLLADSIGVVVFVRLPFQLIEHRSTLLEAGVMRNFVNWLIANAFIVAAVLVAIVVAYWWRAWRRRGGGTSGRSSPVVSVAAGALLAASLPACAVAPRVTNTTIATQRLAHVPGPDSLRWEINGAPAGGLRRHEYRSARFAETRDVWVYTPPGYDARGTRRYPVLYLLHGANEDASAWSTAGRVNVILDNLLAAGAIEPMIVAMPLGYGFPDAASRAGEMLSPATDQFAVMQELAAGLLEEVLPLLDREYRTRPETAARAIAGLSMGGSQALYLGLNHPETFGTVASFGGAVIMYGGRYAQWFPKVGAAGSSLPHLISISVGTEDFLLGANRHFVHWLKSRGAVVRLDEVPGGHTWRVWRRELIRLAQRLFREHDDTPRLDQEIR